MNYENIEKKYAPYKELKIDLEELEEKNNQQNPCKVKQLPQTPLYNKKCSQKSTKKESNYIFDKEIRKTDDCKEILYNHKVKSINQERDNYNKLMYNKNIKQLFPRTINTIPYKVKKTYEYNPEIETLIQSGYLNSNKKSNTTTSEEKNDTTPLVDYVKDKINNKNNLFDISRFQLSSRNLKGDKTYMNNYKNKLNSIKKTLNNK